MIDTEDLVISSVRSTYTGTRVGLAAALVGAGPGEVKILWREKAQKVRGSEYCCGHKAKNARHRTFLACILKWLGDASEVMGAKGAEEPKLEMFEVQERQRDARQVACERCTGDMEPRRFPGALGKVVDSEFV